MLLLWTAFALLTAAVLAWMLAPLGRSAVPVDADAMAAAGARAVYRDQLAEIETERAHGAIGETEAEAAKLEVSRRLLASTTSAPGVTAAADAGPARGSVPHAGIAIAAAIAVPLLTLPLYLAVGSPDRSEGLSSAQSEAARGRAVLAEMVARVEQRLREAPGDGKGWEVIAPAYLSQGRFADAAKAYANAVRLQGESVKLLAGLAEASVLANDGTVTQEARQAYGRILKLQPGLVQPRFWLALGMEQDGRLADALAEYTALLKEAPADASYRASLETRIKEVSANIAAAVSGKTVPVAKAPPGPTASDLDAAARLTPAERQQMVAGMVDGLARRLKADGKDLPGWLRLLNAYAVLGRHDEARAALAEARRNFAGDQRALADLTQLAAKLGLGT